MNIFVSINASIPSSPYWTYQLDFQPIVISEENSFIRTLPKSHNRFERKMCGLNDLHAGWSRNILRSSVRGGSPPLGVWAEEEG